MLNNIEVLIFKALIKFVSVNNVLKRIQCG